MDAGKQHRNKERKKHSGSCIQPYRGIEQAEVGRKKDQDKQGQHWQQGENQRNFYIER